MRFFREARLSDFYEEATLQVAGQAVWAKLQEYCGNYCFDFSELKQSQYVNNYVVGFGQCLGILHTVKPAGSLFGSSWPEVFSRLAFEQQFEDWDAEQRSSGGVHHKFAEGFADGICDGVAYFAGLPFANRGMLTGMQTMEKFARLQWHVRHKAEDR